MHRRSLFILFIVVAIQLCQLIPYVDSIQNVSLLTLGDLWETRSFDKGHLFPTKISTIYPEFAAIPLNGAASRIHLTKSSVENEIENRNKNGALVHSVCSYRHLNVTFYTINTMSGTGQNEVLIDANMTEIERKMAEMTARRIKVNFICVGANNDTYSAVWHFNSNFVWHFIVESGSIMEIIEKDRLQMTRGYYADCFQTYRSDNGSRAIIIWRKGFGKKYQIQYGTALDEMLIDMEQSRLEPVQLSSLPRQGRRRSIPRWLLWHGDEFSWSNYQTIPRNVTAKFNLEKLNKVLEDWMRLHNIPSVSLHVIRNNEEEYSAAFGFSDILINIRATTLHRYRIASVSKVITAMGISEIFSSSNTDILTPIFGANGILEDLCNPCHPLFYRINVLHLLEHSSGSWPHTKKFEFDQQYQNQTDLLRHVLRDQPPLFPPGQRHLYSNIGYILLGRVIEKLSKMSYEEYIQTTILKPLGINATIGKEGDANKEVTYYSHDNANAYTSWNTTILDSAAGWSMTAKEVARIFNYLENNKLRKYRWIITPSLVRWNYGRGIQLGTDGSLYHIGSLAGTEAIGYSWNKVQIGILTNIRGKEQNEQTRWMEKLCRRIADGEFLK
ncbi:unnamed protein product [Caenorhabditis bovis]|uniref:Beta-lactamase-related domain-containing protein n=1 Tax=Caenorhabditis bovis TaxID=2654633 RepID=A0A8S1E834_9PELO|nr:unnamed protein product [Caenorhabditis bovis]